MTHSNWPMLEYVPVRGAWERVQYRSIRAARKGMTRVFKERGLFEFAARMDVLRKNPKLNGAEKRLVFEGILNDYAAFVTTRQTPQPTTEAAPVEAAGSTDVAVPSAERSVVADVIDGPRVEPADSVSDVASEDVGVALGPDASDIADGNVPLDYVIEGDL